MLIGLAVFEAIPATLLGLFDASEQMLQIGVPLAYAFAKLFGLYAVWYAYPIAEIVSVLLCIIFLKKILKEKLKDWDN